MILDWIFPRICIGCGQKGSYLCSECKKQLHPHPEICPFCHKKSENFQTCSTCKESQVLQGLIIGFSYKTVIKKLILKAKFSHKKDVIPFLGERLSFLVKTNKVLNISLNKKQLFVSYVPSHWKRKYIEKGYNQSELLAKSLANQLDIPMLTLASKYKYTLSQLHLNREQRKENMKGVFCVHDLSRIPQNSTVLLVDDVTTTGSTLSELAKTIYTDRHDINIRGIVVARNMN